MRSAVLLVCAASLAGQESRFDVRSRLVLTGERGCAGVMTFAERITWLQDCTRDPDELDRAFGALTPARKPGQEKKARMLDAVQSAVEHLRRKPNSRRVLLLISETRDRGSETALEAATVAAQTAGVTVYAATYSAFKTAFTSKAPVSDPPRRSRPEVPNDTMGTHDGRPQNIYNPKIPPPEQRVDLLAALGELSRLHDANATDVLTKSTGGAAFSFTRQRALEGAIQQLGTELHAQYVLSFPPSGAPPAYHTIEVRVVRSGEFHIRARPGYWSAGDPR
jgi:VWFA-related protein